LLLLLLLLLLPPPLRSRQTFTAVALHARGVVKKGKRKKVCAALLRRR